MRSHILRIACVLLAISVISGCRYSYTSGLPEHIQTVRVPVFQCNEFYYGMESRLTRAVIEELVRDPRVEVVREGEDALLTGEIVEVKKTVVRSDQDDRPASIRLNITVQLSFEDKVQGKMLIDNRLVRSSASSSAAGVYDLDRGEQRSTAEAQAIEELAVEIVRQTVGMW